jgi:protein-tyrosine-phosphatase
VCPTDDRAADDSTFRIAFVCTGNRGRSPFAAQVLRDLTGYLPVSVESFGTLDVGPAPALTDAVWAADLLGADLRSHRARVLRKNALRGADLVIGFEPFHVAEAVVTGGALRERSFLVTEFVATLWQLRDAGAQGRPTARAVVQRADAGRSAISTEMGPIADPVSLSRRDVLVTFELIRDLVEVIADGLFDVRPSRPSD